ncbi:MAG: trehalose-6-phosphate synthase [Dehalococcoidia bacterium]|nr:MAG: trehalose-6-phosphate synthase [Dehalococcoidia bacterium]
MATQRENSRARLSRLCQELLEKRSIILASNRGPIEYHINEDGKLQGRRGSGGVVTALSAISQYVDLTWIASAMGEGDRRAAERAQGSRLKAPLPGHNLYLRFIVFPGSTYHKFYSVLCNPLLWFLQHYMWNSSHAPNIDARVYDAWENGYVAVNRAFAEAVIAEALEGDRPSLVMLHDYHLYLAAGYIRKQIPNVLIQHFTHIPWPGPHYWRLLPYAMRKAICEGLCANDIVGFQTISDVRNFLHTCEAFIEGAEVDYRSRIIFINRHPTRVNPYPISVDVANLQRVVTTPWVQGYEEKLRPLCGSKTIVRVDRMDPSKNIVRGFRAFDMLLQQYPDLLGKVNFLAFLVPSRTHIRQYQRYTQEVNEVIEAINAKYGTEEWQPIRVFYENNYAQALAGLRLYDVLLVNSVIDGMNLVAKEGPTVNTCDGVLVLSEATGAYAQLGEYALTIAPTDLVGTKEALYRALTMSAEERSQRAAALRKSIEEEDISLWLYRQLEDLNALVREQSPQAIQEIALHRPPR